MTIALDKPQFTCHHTRSVAFTVYDTKWLACSARFAVLGQNARGQGVLQVWQLEPSGIKCLKETEKPHPFKCSTFGASSLQTRHLATGDFDGRIAVWDLERLEPVFSAKAHAALINCIDGAGAGPQTGPPEVATGSKDGCVQIYDVRQRDKAVASVRPRDGEAARDTWAVAFGNSYNDSERMVAAGYDNGDIKLFDLRKMAAVWETNVKNGVCSLEFDRKDTKMNKLVATTLESKFHVFDLRTQHPIKGFASAPGNTTTWLVKHLPQNRDVFITSGGNGDLELFKYNYPVQRSRKEAGDGGQDEGVPGTLDLLHRTTTAEQPISALDWSPDKLGLCVFGAFDQTVRIGLVTKLKGL